MQSDVVPLNNAANKLVAFQKFATELTQQIQAERPKSLAAAATARTTHADWVQRAKQYSLVEPIPTTTATEPEAATAITASTSHTSGKKQGKDKRSYRKTSEDEDENPTTDALPTPAAPNNRVGFLVKANTQTPAVDTPLDSRLLDLKERDDFAQRLLQRDKDRQRSANIQQEEPTSLESSSIPLDKLREESRRAYLKKRTEKELTLLEQEIKEEEEMFQDDMARGKLTQQELKRIELGKQILQLARKDALNHEDAKETFYHLPDDDNDEEEEEDEEGGGSKKRKHLTKEQQNQALLKSRYKEDKGSKTEQQIWEETQVKKASSSSYMGNKKHKNHVYTTHETSSLIEKEYDLILEDPIDFILQDSKDGYDHRKNKDSSTGHNLPTLKGTREDEDLAAQEDTLFLTKREKMAMARKKLPVYPYREEFLAALQQHQVMILVGETGSGKT